MKTKESVVRLAGIFILIMTVAIATTPGCCNRSAPAPAAKLTNAAGATPMAAPAETKRDARQPRLGEGELMNRYLKVLHYWQDGQHQTDINGYNRFVALMPNLTWTTEAEAEKTVAEMEATIPDPFREAWTKAHQHALAELPWPLTGRMMELERRLFQSEAAMRHDWDTRDQSAKYMTGPGHEQFVLLHNSFLAFAANRPADAKASLEMMVTMEMMRELLPEN